MAETNPDELFAFFNLGTFGDYLNNANSENLFGTGPGSFVYNADQKAKESGIPGLEYVSDYWAGGTEFGGFIMKMQVVKDAIENPAKYATEYAFPVLVRDYVSQQLDPSTSRGTGVDKNGNQFTFNAETSVAGQTDALSRIQDISKYLVENNYMAPEVITNNVNQVTNDTAKTVAIQQSGRNGDSFGDAVKFLAPAALAVALPGIGTALTGAYTGAGMSATAASIAAGSTIGAGTSALMGGDVLKGAVLGGAAGGYFGGSGANTDYLGSQALGDATTGAVGSGSTGFGINASSPSIGFNAGTGSLFTSAPIESGFGISTNPPAGNFGEFSPNIGSGVSGSSGVGIDTGMANDGYLGVGSASDVAAKSGLGYLGGADALPSGTAGIKSNVPESDSLNNNAKKLSDSLRNGQQQQSGISPYMLVKGLTDNQKKSPFSFGMNNNPFTYTQQTPIQGNNAPLGATPLNLSDQSKNLASLLRNF